MAKVTVESPSDLKEWAGKELGVSDWMEVSQEQVDLFAKATGDFQWIHVDPERAARESPYGRTIAHGFLTLSLIPPLRDQVVEVRNKKMVINYGLNRVRFPAPVPVGEKVRLRAGIASVEERKGGLQVVWSFTIEVSGQDKPACVCEAVSLFIE